MAHLSGATDLLELRSFVPSQPHVLVSPSHGTIPPFSSISLTVTFQPVAPPPQQSSHPNTSSQQPSSASSYSAILKISGSEGSAQCSITAQAFHPLHSLSLIEQDRLETVLDQLDFGRCLWRASRKQQPQQCRIIRFTNHCSTLPLDFQCTVPPHFHVHPSAGLIDANSSIDVEFRFFPQALGPQRARFRLIYADGKYRRDILLCGEAVSSLDPPQQRYHQTGWRDPEATAPYAGRFTVQPNSIDNLDTFTPAELAAVTANRSRYDSYQSTRRQALKDRMHPPNRTVRLVPLKHGAASNLDEYSDGESLPPELDYEEAKYIDSDSDDAIDPGLPQHPTSLHLLKTMGMYKASASAEQLLQNAILTAKRCRDVKAQPTTKGEMIDCTATLDQASLSKLRLGPITIDLGRLCTGELSEHRFTFFNGLELPILFAWKLDYELSSIFSELEPKSAVLPPSTLVDFSVRFRSALPKDPFSLQLPFTINGIHPGAITCTGVVTLPDLQLSTRQLSFGFDHSEDLKSVSHLLSTSSPTSSLTLAASQPFACHRTIRLSNRFQRPIDFTIVPPASTDSFSATPSRGHVPAGSSLDVAVAYSPSASQPAFNAEMQVQITDGFAAFRSSTLLSHLSFQSYSCHHVLGRMRGDQTCHLEICLDRKGPLRQGFGSIAVKAIVRLGSLWVASSQNRVFAQ